MMGIRRTEAETPSDNNRDVISWGLREEGENTKIQNYKWDLREKIWTPIAL